MDYSFFESENNHLIHNRINMRGYFGNNLSLGLEIRNRVFLGDIPTIQTDEGLIDMSYNIFREEKFVLHSMIDRFWLKYQKNKIEISVGRQRVNWGVNTIWNNNDLFNAYNFIDFDYIERPGSDVIRFIYTGDNLSSFELVYLPSERKGYSLAGLYKLNSFGYDFQILAANYFEDIVIGGGWAGNIKNAGFKGELSYFVDKENIKNTFVGHPLLENKENFKTNLSNIIDKNKKIISLFAGSRTSETNILLPILIDFIKLMNAKFNQYYFIFHATDQNKDLIKDELKKKKFNNVEVISDESIKFQILSKSIFAVAKSGTVSLEICNLKVPSIIIYKMNVINFLIVKFLVKVKFANIINIINQKEIIPELIQNECNAKEIFRSVVYFLKNPELMNKQINDVSNTLNQIKSKTSSSAEASAVVLNYLDV